MTDERIKKRGVVYTPDWLVDLILDRVGFDGSRGSLLDPACGDGAFLLAAVRRVIRRGGANKAALRRRLRESIRGADIDPVALAECARRLTACAAAAGVGDIKWNLSCGDCLEKQAADSLRGRADFVVGNPPYVRIQNLGEARRETLRREWPLCAEGSADLYIAFFQLGWDALKPGGRLGYVTPNTWLKTRAARPLRRFLRREKSVRELIDFEDSQLFAGVTTYSVIAVLEKGGGADRFSLLKGDEKGVLRPLGKVAIADMEEDNWILCAPDSRKRLRQMRETRTPLSAIADIHVGVTTLADNCYIFRRPRFGGDMAEIRHPMTQKPVWLEAAILRPIVKASVLKATGEEQGRHVLFPYRRVGGRHRLIGEDELAANFPHAHAYLRSIRPILDARDRGKPNPAGWHAFGRSQGLDTSFGEKILTSPMNSRPNFVVWDKPDHAFYAGYCVKFSGDLRLLADCLNSGDMAFYIDVVSRRYRDNYKSFAKAFLRDFPVPPAAIVSHRDKTPRLLPQI